MALELLSLAYSDSDHGEVDMYSYYLTRLNSIWGDGLIDEWTESYQDLDSEADYLNSLDSTC